MVEQKRKNLNRFFVVTAVVITALLVGVFSALLSVNVIVGSAAGEIEIEYDSRGGSHVDSVVVMPGEVVSAPEAPVKRGYTFLYWSFNGQEYIFENAPDESIKLYAEWAPNTDTPYTVRFLKRVNNTNEYVEVAEDRLLFTGVTGEKIEYAIDYNKYPHFEVNETLTNTESFIEPNGNGELKVFYRQRKYEITYDANGGEASTLKQSVYFGDNIPTVTAVYTDREFLGWRVNGAVASAVFNYNDNVTFTAEWSDKQIKVHFDTQGGSHIESLTLTENGRPEKPEIDPVRENYDFVGWFLDKDGKEPVDFENLTVEESITVYAVWKYNYAPWLGLMVAFVVLCFAVVIFITFVKRH